MVVLNSEFPFLTANFAAVVCLFGTQRVDAASPIFLALTVVVLVVEMDEIPIELQKQVNQALLAVRDDAHSV